MMFRVYSRIPQGQCASIAGTVFAANPLLSSTMLAKAQIVGRRVLIPILPRWAVLFRGVKTFGRVISFCRNGCAVLGSVGVYPEVLTTPCGRSDCGGDGEFKFFFPQWARAFVTVEEHAGSWLYATEFQDACGDVIYKVCLTSESDLQAFRWWVELNQASNPAPGFLRDMRSPSRVEGPAALCEGEARFLSGDDLRMLFRGMIETEVSVRISVGNDGLVQAARVRPDPLKEEGACIYLGDDESGLQLRVDRLADVSLHRSLISSNWMLKAYESEGFPACTVEPARGESSEGWERLLRDVMRSFSKEPEE